MVSHARNVQEYHIKSPSVNIPKITESSQDYIPDEFNRSVPCKVCGKPIPLTGRRGRPDWYCIEHKMFIQANHRAVRKGTQWNTSQRKHILERDENTCVYCGCHATGIDHVLPVSMGGIHSVNNGVCSCFECNRIKGWKTDIRGLKHLASKGEDMLWAANIKFEVWYGETTYYAWIP